MPRREYYLRVNCAHEGCREHSNYVFDRRADEQAERERVRKHGWRCVRHTQPDHVLSPDAQVREAVLAIYETDFGYPNQGVHRFWVPEGATKGGNGFVYGPGFKAFAKDFPVGTRLIVTARIEIPEGGQSDA